MPAQLSIHATERSTYIVTASFTDENGDAVTPKSVIWTLSDSAGNIVNDREAVSETPAASVAIVLSGGDLVHADDDLPRVVTVEAVYDSATYGDNLHLNNSIEFLVDNLVIALGCDKVFEDEEGASFWPDYPGLISLDGSAAVRFEGADITPWKGTAGSETPYIIRLHDSALKTIWGYLADADGALALGSELGIADLTSGEYSNQSNITVLDANSLTIDTIAGYMFDNITVTALKLYKLSFTPTLGTAIGPKYAVYNISNTTFIFSDAAMSDGIENVRYFIAPAGCTEIRLYPIRNVTGIGSLDIDNISLKEVTALGTDGCHIVNTKDGSIQNWADREAGFNYNDSSGYTFEVMNACYVL